MTVTVPERPVLATIPRVELMHAGTWDISTGQATFTDDDLRQAVDALTCSAIRRPILKLGHVDERWDGEPAIGYVDNMSTDGSTLWGDYAGVPRWLADVMASAYPDRSIEGYYDYQCQIGHTHPFVLTAVALLGVTAPGIGTLASLQDIAGLYGVAAAPANPTARPVQITERTVMATVKASVTVEDVRRAFYGDAPYSQWIEEIQLDSAQLIVADDESGDRVRIPYTVDGTKDGTDAVTFGDPVPVVIRYEDAPAKAPADAPAASRVHYASRATSRPAATTDSPAIPSGDTPTEGSPVDQDKIIQGLIAALGLDPATATEDEILAKVTERLSADPEPEAGEESEAQSAGEVTPEVEAKLAASGMAIVSKTMLTQLQANAALGAKAYAKQEADEREELLAAARADGRISRATTEEWRKALAASPDRTRRELESLPKGLIPVEAAGYTGVLDDDKSADDALYNTFFPSKEA